MKAIKKNIITKSPLSEQGLDQNTPTSIRRPEREAESMESGRKAFTVPCLTPSNSITHEGDERRNTLKLMKETQPKNII